MRSELVAMAGVIRTPSSAGWPAPAPARDLRDFCFRFPPPPRGGAERALRAAEAAPAADAAARAGAAARAAAEAGVAAEAAAAGRRLSFAGALLATGPGAARARRQAAGGR